MIKSIQEGYNLLFLVFVIICLYGSGNSEQLKEDYTPVANNNIEELRLSLIHISEPTRPY